MTNWEAVDWVVFMLAAAMSLGVLITTVQPYFLKEAPSDERSKSLSAVSTAILAIISVYVGYQIGEGGQ